MSSGSSSTSFSTSSDGPPPRRGGFTKSLIFLGLVIAVSMAFYQFRGMKVRGGRELDRLKAIPEFSLTTQEGKPLALGDLKDKIWVAGFIFTRCPGPCPAITGRMAELQAQISKSTTDDVRLVSFTVDPENDTPEVLKAYADAFHADPARWSFLTGDPAKVRELIEKGFLQTVIPGEPENLTHSVRLVVVDGDGIMRSYHDGTDPEVLQKVLLDIGALLRERGKGKRN